MKRAIVVGATGGTGAAITEELIKVVFLQSFLVAHVKNWSNLR